MNLQEQNLIKIDSIQTSRQDQKFLIKNFIKKTKVQLKDKIVLEIGSDMELSVAKVFLALGAKEIWCVNPKFLDSVKSPDEKIKLIKDFGEKTNLPDGYFDVIFGIALLEHVLNVKDLALAVKRLLHPDGIAFLQGDPVYTSPCGHHVWVRAGKHYRFNTETNPFKNWEHLLLRTKEDIEQNLKFKNIPEEDIPKIVSFCLSDDISKYEPSKIIKDIKSVKGLKILSQKYYTKEEENLYYKKARKYYSKADLKTRGISVYICHKNKRDSFVIDNRKRKLKLLFGGNL